MEYRPLLAYRRLAIAIYTSATNKIEVLCVASWSHAFSLLIGCGFNLQASCYGRPVSAGTRDAVLDAVRNLHDRRSAVGFSFTSEFRIHPNVCSRSCSQQGQASGYRGVTKMSTNSHGTICIFKRWFHTLAPGLRDDPAPPRKPAADARSFGKSFGGPLRLCLLPCGPSCEDESSLTSPKSVLDLPPSLDMVAGAGAARGADRHLLRSQSEADDEGDGDSPASAATSPPPSAFASLAATSPTSPTAPTAPASSAASQRGAE